MAEKEKKKLHWSVRLTIALLVFVFVVGALFGAFHIGVEVQKQTFVHWRPDYEKTDILPLLEKETRSEEDYALLYRQTGLTKLGIEGLLEKGNINRILSIQENYFAENQVISKQMSYGTYIEYVKNEIPLAKLENGDILVSACTFLSFFRFGHSALVVDGELRLLLESYSYGVPSKIGSIVSMNDLSTLMVLRPKCDVQTREKAVEYAKRELTGLPYDFFVGFFSEKYPDTIKTTQCTHILWYAYKKFGIDLDSNGGGIVKPQDIANSDQLELVQVYGFDPQTLWS